jgi:hypothetical protein
MAKRALAVGVSGYGFPNELPSGTRDAEAFGNMLETIYRFDQVRVLKDGEATRDGVDRGLDWLFQDATSNDRLVFFFSGHGCRFEKSGTIEEALVLSDGRLLGEHHLVDRLDTLPPGVFTAVLDCCFTGLDEMVVHPGGEVEVMRAKRWVPTDADRGRSERVLTAGTKAFTPFGHVKAAAPEALAAHLRAGPALDPSPARLIALAEPQTKGLFVMACLADETTVTGTSQTGGLSPFTQCLLNEIRRRGPNRSTFELLQATGHELRRLGLRQTPLVKEPSQPERLGLRAFLTFQPVLAVYPSHGPGREPDDDLVRSIAEAVRTTLMNIQEGRSMQGTMPGAQTFFAEPYAPHGWWQGGFGQPQQGFGQPQQVQEIAQIVSAVVPAVVACLQQNRVQQPQLGFGQQQSPFGGGWGYQGLPPYEIAQIAQTVTPIVASLLQSRGYQGHFGQFLPRAA